MAARDTSAQPEEAFRLREYLAVLRFHKWSIVLITVLVVLAALYYTKHQTRQYTSTVDVIATDPLQPITNPNGRGPVFSVESSLVTSLPVKQCATQILANPADNVLGTNLDAICPFNGAAVSSTASATPTPTPTPSATPSASATPTPAPTPFDRIAPKATLTDGLKVQQPTTTAAGPGAGAQGELVLQISDTETSPRQAQDVAQAFALAYQAYKISGAMYQLDQLTAPLNQQLGTVQKSLDTATANISKTLTAISGATDSAVIASNTAKLTSYEQQRQQLEDLKAQLDTQLLNLSPSKLNRPEVAGPATLPTKPSRPNKVVNAGLGLILGLAFAIGLAFLREKLDDRLRGREDLEQRAGAPVLAIIPKIPAWWHREESHLVVSEKPTSPAAEAFRTLRTNVSFVAARDGAKVVMVASGGAGEGKTSIASNLALSLATAGKRVILVSADLRKPRLHEFFHLPNEAGVSNVLGGQAAPWEVLLQPEGIDNLRILSSGPVSSQPAELLQSDEMTKLIDGMRPVTDFVILDTAPVLLVSDALTLAPMVDGVILVADAIRATRNSIEHTREQLDAVGAPVIGAVLNRLDRRRARYYGKYYYGYYYYSSSYGTYGNGYGAKRQEMPAPEPMPSLLVPPSER